MLYFESQRGRNEDLASLTLNYLSVGSKDPTLATQNLIQRRYIWCGRFAEQVPLLGSKEVFLPSVKTGGSPIRVERN